MKKKLTANMIPLTDPYVYEFIGEGNTSGIFQIESPGMQNLMKQMFSDVSSKLRTLEKKYSCKGYDVKYLGKEKDENSTKKVKNKELIFLITIITYTSI